MARYTGPVCRMCRREGCKLFLRASRATRRKCAFERRENPPGMHTFRRGKLTDYGIHLREKQKVKHYYGVLERQFRKYFEQAERAKGNTGEVLMSLLERRLDNVVHRLGFGLSRAQARQMISHGHVTVNGRRVDVPSYLVRPGDVIRVKNRPKSLQLVQASLAEIGREVPDFLSRGRRPTARRARGPAARGRRRLDSRSDPIDRGALLQVAGVEPFLCKPLQFIDRRLLMRIRWRGLELPSQVIVRQGVPDGHLRQVRRRAVRARVSA